MESSEEVYEKPVGFGVRLYSLVFLILGSCSPFLVMDLVTRLVLILPHRMQLLIGIFTVCSRTRCMVFSFPKKALCTVVRQIVYVTLIYFQHEARLIATDNFYRRNCLVEKITRLTKREIHLLGTVRLTTLDMVSWRNLNHAVDSLKNAPCGTWYLCRPFTKFLPSFVVRIPNRRGAVNAGYIVWKDCNLLVFMPIN